MSMNTSTSPDSELFDYRQWPNCLAALMMFVNCILGITFNGAIIYVFMTDNSQKTTSFNLMCVIRAFNSIAALTLAFFLVYIPDTLLGFSIYNPWIESFLVCLSLNFYMFNEFQSYYISVNRFVAIYFPLHYNKFCGVLATNIVQLVLLADRVVNVAVETYQRTNESMYISFSPEYLMFTSVEVTGTGAGMLFAVALMFLVALVVNVLTFAKITFFYWKSGSRDDVETKSRIQKNGSLFLQTVLQDFLFFVDNFFTFQMSSLSNHRFWYFICATFVWQSVHVVDGFIMMMFSDRMVILKRALFRSARVASIETSATKTHRRQSLPNVD